MEYKVVEASSAFGLENAVAKLISEGWIPLGGVAGKIEDGVLGVSLRTTLLQAMFRQLPSSDRQNQAGQ